MTVIEERLVAALERLDARQDSIARQVGWLPDSELVQVRLQELREGIDGAAVQLTDKQRSVADELIRVGQVATAQEQAAELDRREREAMSAWAATVADRLVRVHELECANLADAERLGYTRRAAEIHPRLARLAAAQCLEPEEIARVLDKAFRDSAHGRLCEHGAEFADIVTAARPEAELASIVRARARLL